MRGLAEGHRVMPLLDAGLPLYTSPGGRAMAFCFIYSPNHKTLGRILYSLVLISLINVSPSFGQQAPRPQLDPAELKELVRLAGLRVSEYKAKFKDLTADEEQHVEEYESEGKLKRQRRIVSDLIIYQSQLDASVTVEYRNARAVDGAPVAKRDERLVNLFERLTKAGSIKKELDRINRESRRYDLGYSIYGMTLNQGLPLEESVRESFRFTSAGGEQINGREVIVLQYQQVAQIPDQTVKLSLPSVLKGAEALYRGRLWLDAETAQLWREEREVTLKLPSLAHPLIWMRFEFDYVSSSFGILTPQRIVAITNNRGRTLAGNVPELLLGGKVTFQYSGFRHFDVSSPDASLDSPAKP
jgi:hypothetical protein